MEGTDNDSLSACLLQWVQAFPDIGKVEHLRDLIDGRGLWAILKQVDPSYFTGELPEPEVSDTSEWTRKWQNLKHIEKQVAVYYRDICNGQEHFNDASAPDVKVAAAEGSVKDLERLIMTIIRAAMASPESNQRMVQRLMGLGRENAMVIASELRNMEEGEVAESGPASRDESAYQSEQETVGEAGSNGTKMDDGGLYQDPLLERETELLQAQATIQELRASQNSAHLQLRELRQDKERLQEAFDAYRNELDTKGRKTAGDDAFKKLQRQSENDRAYIDDLESQMQSSRNTIENYDAQLKRLKDESEAGQKLRDELQMLRAENTDLDHKVKANENLKKKIQSLQEQEKANATLREEVKTANERLEELEKYKSLKAHLEKEILEKQGLIRNQEYQITELTTTRKHAEYDARVLAQKVQEARDRHDRDHEAIEDLRAKLQDADIAEPEQRNLSSTTEGSADKPATPQAGDATPRIHPPRDDDSKHANEKLALLQQQLDAADARLKQAAERNAVLEEASRTGASADSEAAQTAAARAAEHEGTIASLRRELETAKTKEGRPAAPLSGDAERLARENRLVAGAWYDLAGRLQLNGVGLGRRKQEPKSWIGKQRGLVGPGVGAEGRG